MEGMVASTVPQASSSSSSCCCLQYNLMTTLACLHIGPRVFVSAACAGARECMCEIITRMKAFAIHRRLPSTKIFVEVYRVISQYKSPPCVEPGEKPSMKMVVDLLLSCFS